MYLLRNEQLCKHSCAICDAWCHIISFIIIILLYLMLQLRDATCAAYANKISLENAPETVNFKH